MKAINTIIGTIGRLEDKRDNGTITMDEETQLIKLIERTESLLN